MRRAVEGRGSLPRQGLPAPSLVHGARTLVRQVSASLPSSLICFTSLVLQILTGFGESMKTGHRNGSFGGHRPSFWQWELAGSVRWSLGTDFV